MACEKYVYSNKRGINGLDVQSFDYLQNATTINKKRQ